MDVFGRTLRYYVWTELGAARAAINFRCFRGGDEGHRTAWEEAYKTADKCF